MSSRPTTYLVSLVLLCLAASSFANAATATRPRVDFSTYLSGNDYTEVTASTVDSKGYLYLAGYTWADDFPTTAGAFLRTPRTVCTDSCRSHATFVVKLNRHGNGLIYSTFINEAAPTDIAVDPAGNAYLTGSRVEDDYAGTTGTLHTKCSNGANPGGCNWLAKLNSTGSAIVFSTIINETTQCWYNAKIGLNPKNEIYLADAAYTFSPCPTTVNAFRKSVSSAATAVQVMKFSADGKSLLFSTFVSSPDPYDSIANLVVDRNDHAIVAGTTLRPYFPVTQSAFQKTRRNGSQTAFISKISSDGSTLLASTLLGGSNPTESYGLEVDHDLNVYVAGLTYSYDFPTTPGAYQRQHEPRGNCGEGSSILDCPDMFIKSRKHRIGRHRRPVESLHLLGPDLVSDLESVAFAMPRGDFVVSGFLDPAELDLEPIVMRLLAPPDHVHRITWLDRTTERHVERLPFLRHPARLVPCYEVHCVRAELARHRRKEI